MNQVPDSQPQRNASIPFELELGATPGPSGTTFRVWAPHAQRAFVVLTQPNERIPMSPEPLGYWSATVADAGAGTDYRFVLDDGEPHPDPVSRFQPDGVHGPSRVVDPRAFAWSDRDFRGVRLDDYVIYELHVGTFTPEGTFDAAIGKLSYLHDLGVTAVELMPVAQFPGTRNWGYDGAYLFAPQNSYGGPEGLKRLVNACHEQGLACVMDVVYNHLGPEGNYLGVYGPYFTSKYLTPWGAALNFDGPDSDPVRRFFLDNARMWLCEYHIDALRLDAIHGIFDFSARHILSELSDVCTSQARFQGRPLFLIAESDLNDVRIIASKAEGGYAIDAQWSDDFHHALWTSLGGPRQGYFEDFGRIADLAHAFREAFVYNGRYAPHRRRRHGNSAAERPGHKFVVYSQNHDQIANGSQGARMSTRLGPERERLAATLLLTGPNLPMLFMGQEYGETRPFAYFVSHGDPQLSEAVRKGRKDEFDFFGFDQDFADPTQPETFEACRLDWEKLHHPAHAPTLALFKDLMALREKHALIKSGEQQAIHVESDETTRWLSVLRRNLVCDEWVAILANFSAVQVSVPLLAPNDPAVVLLASDEPIYGGEGMSREARPVMGPSLDRIVQLSPWSAVVLGPGR
ncbi:MAG: malto-oligosyltrehalose trehalohydrolase [Myxococcales bacterium]|nr:malto-oligosyltrehalose trehalohydrolase [Myxococcales bacterium]